MCRNQLEYDFLKVLEGVLKELVFYISYLFSNVPFPFPSHCSKQQVECYLN